ncbi:hypothetical protein PANDA_005604, partial [Ailuropoda melanoleuca]
ARYQWVCCSPGSNSANCIDEEGPIFNLLPGESNRSGFLTEIEQEYKPVDENNAFYYNFRPLKRSLPSDTQDLGQDGPEKMILL